MCPPGPFIRSTRNCFYIGFPTRVNLGEGDTPLVKPSCRGWATFPMAASLGSCCWSMLPTGIRVSSFILPLCCPSKPTSDHLLLGSPFRLPFSGGGCCCKSLLSECWSVLGKAASLAVVVVMHPGAGCVCRRYGHASSLALPGLVSLSDDSLLKDWESGHSQPCLFHNHCNALLSFCASASMIL